MAFSWIFRRFFPHEIERATKGAAVRYALLRSYPYPGSRPLPRGTITRVAHDTGASLGYVSKIAHKLGYTVEHMP